MSPGENSELILQVQQLTKRFPLVVANDAVNFDVRRGEIHCLLGENGAGKSTLSECLYGYYRPDEGDILFKGRAVRFASPSDAIRCGIGMVHQHFSLVEPFTVLENVLLGAESTGVLLDIHRVETRLTALCRLYEVDLDLNAKIWQLAVGQQQWVEILKALYAGVELLILDEPTAVLTPQESERLFAVLQRMKAEGLSIIFITHKLREVMAVSDRVTVLRRGKRIATVNTAEVTMQDLARLMVGREVVFRIQKEEVARGAPILEIRDLCAANDFGRQVLQGVSLSLHQNEILGLAGVAGNGQKELFEVLVGVRRSTGGSLTLNGRDVTNRPPRYLMSQGLGYIPDDRIKAGLVPDFTVGENLILGEQREPRFRDGVFLSESKIDKFAQTCIAGYEIATPSARHRTRFLSGGNLQKVILARELNQEIRVLLANQPTRGLDVGVTEYVYRTLLDKRGQGLGILMASEDLDDLMALCDRIAVIFRGQIMGLFDPREANLVDIGLVMAGIKADA